MEEENDENSRIWNEEEMMEMEEANLSEGRNIMCLREVNQNIIKSVTKNKRGIVEDWNWEMEENNKIMKIQLKELSKESLKMGENNRVLL